MSLEITLRWQISPNCTEYKECNENINIIFVDIAHPYHKHSAENKYSIVRHFCQELCSFKRLKLHDFGC